MSTDSAQRIAVAQAVLISNIAAEIVAAFPAVTLIGAQIVAALHFADGPLSIGELCSDLGFSKSNVRQNVLALEAMGIVERRRTLGARNDAFALRGAYPDIVLATHVRRLRRALHNEQASCERVRRLLADAEQEADRLCARIDALVESHERFSELLNQFAQVIELPDAVLVVEDAFGEGGVTRRSTEG